MDKILQLSRIERGGELNLTSLKIIPYIKKLSLKWANFLHVDIESNDMEVSIVADEFALGLIIKNLFENTRIHTQSKNVTIKIIKTDKNIVLTYQDQGEFTGDINKLGTLFYKHNSSKGSGIGLYLTNRLLEKMEGELLITMGETKNLIFGLTFKKSEDFSA
jgi:signal transduction histidine kinase